MIFSDLLLNDLFWTFQGEGLHAGRRALFVRLPYCNLKCSWCDTEFNTYKRFSEGDFLQIATAEPSRFAVITGGEPMMNKQTKRVIGLLKGEGFHIACESNGNFPIVPGIDFVTLSPKRDAKPSYFVDPDAFQKAHEFKYVVDQDFDFSLLGRHAPGDGRRYSLSPEFNQLHENLGRIFKFISENPQWRISLQTHKFMRIK